MAVYPCRSHPPATGDGILPEKGASQARALFDPSMGLYNPAHDIIHLMTYGREMGVGYGFRPVHNCVRLNTDRINCLA